MTASIATKGYIVYAKNVDTIDSIIDLSSPTDTLNGVVNGTITLKGGETLLFIVQDTASGYESLGAINPVLFADVLDEDDLVSDSDTHVATQQSIKAYADAIESTLHVMSSIPGIAEATDNFHMFGVNTSGADLISAPVSSNGTVRNLRVYTSGNNSSGSTVFTLYKNGIAQNVTLTIPAGQTGAFADTLNSFTVLAGERLEVRIAAAGGGGGFLSAIRVTFGKA